jgi:hypothetical protein
LNQKGRPPIFQFGGSVKVTAVSLSKNQLNDDLVASNAALQEWAEEQGILWDSWDTDRGSAWHGRVERYLTDPSVVPDPSEWKVEVAYLIAES